MRTQEGRIDETGGLQCSYHGWSFDGSGACTRIPQAAPEGPEARAVRSPRACATKFPTLLSQGLLFVWPDENGWDKAKATKPPMYVRQLCRYAAAFFTGIFSRQETSSFCFARFQVAERVR